MKWSAYRKNTWKTRCSLVPNQPSWISEGYHTIVVVAFWIIITRIGISSISWDYRTSVRNIDSLLRNNKHCCLLSCVLDITRFDIYIGTGLLINADEAPSGEFTPQYVISGNNVTYTCRVSYNSSNFLKMSWTNTRTGSMVSPSENGVRIGSKLLATGEHGHNTLITQESTLTIAVRTNVMTLDPFMCSVYSSAPIDVDQPPTNQQSHTWNSSAIIISCEST